MYCTKKSILHLLNIIGSAMDNLLHFNINNVSKTTSLLFYNIEIIFLSNFFCKYRQNTVICIVNDEYKN